MAINLPPIANPEKVGSFNTNFKMIQDELDNVIRRGGLGVGEPNHMEVDLDMNGNAILNASTDLGNSKSLITVGDADKRYLDDVSADIAGKVEKAGDTMSGTLDMGSNFVRNLPDPVQDTDAATKRYIDDIEDALKLYIDEKLKYVSLSLGGEVDGGIYAGKITYADGREFHIIAAKQSGESDNIKWNYFTDVLGADDPDDGVANTSIMTAFGSSPPANHVNAYIAGGFNDWYVPATNELVLVTTNLAETGHSEFSEASSELRWASTEADSVEFPDQAVQVRFSDSFVGRSKRDTTNNRVRPIRRVAV